MDLGEGLGLETARLVTSSVSTPHWPLMGRPGDLNTPLQLGSAYPDVVNDPTTTLERVSGTKTASPFLCLVGLLDYWCKL